MNKNALTLLFLLLCVSVDILAETIYVSDQLEASLRRGEGTRFAILRMLKSGEALELVEENKSTGYTKVRTRAGTEGFVLSRYLMQQPAARVRLDTVAKDNESLRSKIASLENTITQLQQTGKQQSGQINQLQSEKQQLGKELSGIREATADVISIKRKNELLSKQVQQLKSEKEALSVENRAYRDKTKQDWFIRGAGVLGIGILVGWILPKLRRRRRWGEL